jgi:NitT/TauT family transport system substrate-binding protein
MFIAKPVLAFAAPALLGALVLNASAQELQLTVGMQESGTAQWEIEVITALGLAEKHNLDLELRPLADSRAGQIALQAGAVDVILSDFVWVSIQRNQGNMVTMVPHSLAVGGLMTAPDSGIDGVEDLPGHTVAVAGGPVDKSWITLQAFYNSVTGGNLLDEVEARYGAPPLVNELLASGQADATLNFWHWNARAKAAGEVEVISVAEMLSEMGVGDQPPLLGWTFTDATAQAKPEAIRAFLDASFEAKDLLLNDDAVWQDLRELMGAAEDDALFTVLRDDYRAGIVTSYDPDAMDSAERSFALMAQYGGAELVGDVPTLAEGTFWEGYSRSP